MFGYSVGKGENKGETTLEISVNYKYISAMLKHIYDEDIDEEIVIQMIDQAGAYNLLFKEICNLYEETFI